MTCEECGAIADAAANNWRGYWLCEEGEEPHLVFYCAECAEREFSDQADE